jgi:calcineurin-like phosphoesterase family protein
LLKYSKILREYDFLQRKLLTRFEAKNPLFYRKTEKLLEDYLLGRYDPNRYISPPSIETRQNGFSSTIDSSREGHSSFPNFPEYPRSPFQSIIDYFKPPKVFVISDLHLDHFNIIQYCHRPFPNAGKMNSELLTNWNSVVRKKDKVFFLGDLVFGRSKRTPEYWIKELNGKIELIGGNHDHSEILKFLPNSILEYKGKRFYLVHDPADKPKDWNGWTIHGHHHNNSLVEFPFINGIKKTINVGVELLNYRPLDLDYLFDLDFENIKYMKDINDQPQRFDWPL